MRRSLLWAVIALVLAAVTGCRGAGGSAPSFSESGKLKVVVSFYPLYEFARAVGGERVEVVNLVPPGTEPHDWEPTAAQIKLLNSAQVFFYNGAGFEHWVEKTLKSLDNKHLLAVETSRGFDLLQGRADPHGHAAAGEHEDQEHEGEAAHDHAGEGLDPHIWLDPLGAIHMVEAIRDALIRADSANKAIYEANAAAYVEKLRALDREFQTGLAQCKTNRFFTAHAAFGYLARRYGLEQHAILGLAPDAEPKPRELRAIIAEAKANAVRYIFVAPLVSDRIARVVADEVGAGTLVLNPFEGLTAAEIKAGKDYLSVMRENLTNLKVALECQ